MIEASAKDTGELIPIKTGLGLPGAVSRVGLELPDNLTFEQWEGIGSTLNSVEGSIQWWLGDWLNFGERRYGEMYSQAMDATERSYDSLAQAKWISKSYEFCDRSQNLSWKHHREAASLPESERSTMLERAEAEGWTTRELRSEVNQRKAAKKIKASDGETYTVADLQSLSGRKFGCIYADPPWQYDNQGTRASTENHYSGMTIEELCDLPIGELAAPDAHLHLWTTNAFLFECPKIFAAWGFEFRSSYIWAKPQMGIGNYWRNSHEILLSAIRGDAKRFNDHSLRSWGTFNRTQHSAKPEEIRAMIEKASPGPYLELFARRIAPNWTCWGNQIERTMFDANVRAI